MALLSAKDFLACPGKIFDVRSPGEYSQGHIPGAVNLPLFSDEERARVGTEYKRVGKEEAFQLGLGFAADKIPFFIEEIERLAEGRQARVHCWRGGMRSQSFLSLFQMLGMEAYALQGGYKSFRRFCNDIFSRDADYRVIGGMTGSGKTKILHALNDLGQQTIDLEGLSNHRGSAFGTLEGAPQPTTEQFHNQIGLVLSGYDPARPIWIEDESRMIGRCHLPEELFIKMQKSPLYLVHLPLEVRLKRLKQDYGAKGKEVWIPCVRKLRKKLGPEKTETAIENIEAGNLKEAATLILTYYDKAYLHSLSKRQGQIIQLPEDLLSEGDAARWLVDHLSALSFSP